MENAHFAFFAVVMHPKEAAGDRTCDRQIRPISF